MQLLRSVITPKGEKPKKNKFFVVVASKLIAMTYRKQKGHTSALNALGIQPSADLKIAT